MFNLKQVLLIAILSLASPFNLFGSEPNNIKDFSGYVKVYNQEIKKESERRQDRLANLNEAFLMGKHVSPYASNFQKNFFEEQREEDFDKIEGYVEDILVKSGREFLNDAEGIKDIKNEVARFVKYEILFKNSKSKTDGQPPTLKEEDRLENIAETEDTIVKFDKLGFLGKYSEFHAGVEPRISTNPNLRAYVRAENFKFLGIDFRRGKVTFDAKNDFAFELQKLVGKEEYLQLSIKEEDFVEYMETSLSFIKELREPKSRIVVSAGYDQKERGSFLEASYALRF